MDYRSTYLWEKAECQEYNPVSLVLQQVTVHKQDVLLACVCESKQEGKEGVAESGYFTEALVQWFHKDMLQLLEKRDAEKELGKSLQKEVDRITREISQHAAKERHIEALQCKGLLLLENRFWLFSKGQTQAWLLNRRFNRKHIHLIGENSKENVVVWEEGIVQKRLGLLLCTSNFFRHVEEMEVAEVLALENDWSEERVQRRLQELWRENVLRGENASVGVIFVRV